MHAVELEKPIVVIRNFDSHLPLDTDYERFPNWIPFAKLLETKKALLYSPHYVTELAETLHLMRLFPEENRRHFCLPNDDGNLEGFFHSNW